MYNSIATYMYHTCTNYNYRLRTLTTLSHKNPSLAAILTIIALHTRVNVD